MAAEQSNAIVLRTVEFSETSLIVTLLTQDLGRVSAIAKGARRPKSSFEGSLDLLAVCRVVVLRRSSDSLDILTEAKLHRRFRGADRSIDRLYAGYYVVEMLRLLTDERDPHQDVYDLTIRTLAQIDGTGNVATALVRFDVGLLQMLGHSPGTDRCTDCGGEVVPTRRVAFSLLAGGIVCSQCRPRQQQTLSVKPGVIDLLDELKQAAMDGPDPRSPDPRSPDPSDRFAAKNQAITTLPHFYEELRLLLNRYIITVAGRIPNMQAFLPLKV